MAEIKEHNPKRLCHNLRHHGKSLYLPLKTALFPSYIGPEFTRGGVQKPIFPRFAWAPHVTIGSIYSGCVWFLGAAVQAKTCVIVSPQGPKAPPELIRHGCGRGRVASEIRRASHALCTASGEVFRRAPGD